LFWGACGAQVPGAFRGWHPGRLGGRSLGSFSHPLLGTFGHFPWGLCGCFLQLTRGQTNRGLGDQLSWKPGVLILTQPREPAPTEGV
jgi:hypothetical protein